MSFVLWFEAIEPALKQAEQAGVPVAEDKEQKKWHGEVVLTRYGVPDGEGKVAADRQFDPGDDAKAFAVLVGLALFTLLINGIFRGTGEGALDAEEGFEDGLRIGDGEADAECHQAWQIDEGPVPAARVELFLTDKIER